MKPRYDDSDAAFEAVAKAIFEARGVRYCGNPWIWDDADKEIKAKHFANARKAVIVPEMEV